MLGWVPDISPTIRMASAISTAPRSTSTPTAAGTPPRLGTLIYNYGRTEVVNSWVRNALFWLERYAIDGLRVERWLRCFILTSRPAGCWIPNNWRPRESRGRRFPAPLNTEVFARFPQATTAAEESTSWPRCRGRSK